LGHVKDNKELKSRKDIPSIDLILQTDANPNSKKTIELINLCRSSHIGYAFLPPVFADVPHQLIVERMGLTPLLRFQPTPLDGWGRVWKRAFDIIISSILLILFTPVFILISIAIVIESGFPIFYISRRVGEKGNKNIPMLKFRSMRKNADAQKESLKGKNERIDGPLFKLQNDPRVTRVGRILRRWDLDELPQICNVLIGQMSLVGPRPHLKEEVAKYSEAQRRVFAVKPGVTGLSQVSGRSQLKFAEEVALDLRYIEEWSLLMDLWILWRTIFVVIFRIGAK
jgi:exopolysaccharide biosynthesis polyprenyl glycosylphosphotransferase